MSDTSEDIFAGTKFGKVALQKFAPLPAGFRIYKAEWLNTKSKKPEDWSEMRLTGRQFRAVKRGPTSGRLDIPVSGTVRSVIVSRDEVAQSELASK